MPATPIHDVLVIGGGNGGLSAAAHLRRRGCRDVALVEPSDRHVYKPLQNYACTGSAPISSISRAQRELIPDGVHWYRTAAVHIDGESGTVTCADGSVIRGRDVVLAPGATLDWDALPGAEAALHDGRVITTFSSDELERTRQHIRHLTSGTAVFTVHGQPASGRETAFKPLFLACDHWRRRGVLDSIDVHLVIDEEVLHPVERIARELQRHIDRFDIRVRSSTRLVRVDGGDRAVLAGPEGESVERVDLLHVLPPYAPHAFIAESGLDAPGTGGFAAVDAETLQHPVHARVWCIGDGADLGDARTGGALRTQVKIAVENIRRRRAGREFERYDGYTVAPITTSRWSLSFGEYDRSLRVRRSLRVPDQIRSTPLWYLLDRHVLPWFYWNGILRGRL